MISTFRKDGTKVLENIFLKLTFLNFLTMSDRIKTVALKAEITLYKLFYEWTTMKTTAYILVL